MVETKIKKHDDNIHYEYSFIMSFMLIVVPMINPAKPIRPITTFLKIMNALAYPVLVYQFAHVSSRAGNVMPSVDRANAPINEMNISKLGIKTAITTATKREY